MCDCCDGSDEFAGKGVKYGLVKKEDASLDDYVTQKALDGLFFMVAEEEKKIRQDPVKAGSDIIKKVFGAHAYNLKVSSTKSMIGHLLGAAGGVEAVITVLALNEGVLPPTMNLDNPDPDCDLDYCANAAVTQDVEYALSNSFGFGGHNVTLCFKARR